jgi:TetR/AcrR family transcriptional repressor of nem operon
MFPKETIVEREPSMGRKKRYDRGVLIGKAVEIFRDHGYAGSSAKMLSDGLGVNPNSLYSEFGSKQGLFNAALQRYDEEVVERSFGPLEAEGAGVSEVRALLEFYGSAADGPAVGRGCLLCNTAVEFGPKDPSGAEFVQRYFERLSNAFSRALSNAQERGDLRASADPKEEACFFTASVLGLFVMLRAKASPALIKSASKIAIQHLETLCN